MTGDILSDQLPEPALNDAGLSLFRPPWCDPGWMVGTSWYRYTSVQVTPGTPTLVARANSKRWAVGFGMFNAAAATSQVRLDQNTTTAAPFLLTGPGFLWLYLFQHGPLVCADLYVQSSGITSVGLTEILIQ